MPAMYDSTKPLPIPAIGDTIINVQSDKLPFTRMIRRSGKMVDQMLNSWPVEEYPDTSLVGTLDGADKTTFSSVSRDKFEAVGMLLRSPGAQVTKIANLTRDAGVPKKQEFAKQMRMDGERLARMWESLCLSALEMRDEVKDTTPYRIRGALVWLQHAAQSVRPVPAAYRVAEAADIQVPLDQFTDTRFEEAVAAMAEQRGGNVNLKAIVGSRAKRAMTLWGVKVDNEDGSKDVILSRTMSAADKRLIQVVDKFEFDCGVVYAMTSYFLARDETTGAPTAYSSRSGIFIDTAMWEIAYLQPPTPFQNPDLGGGPRGYHDLVGICRCLNTQGQGRLYTNLDETSAS